MTHRGTASSSSHFTRPQSTQIYFCKDFYFCSLYRFIHSWLLVPDFLPCLHIGLHFCTFFVWKIYRFFSAICQVRGQVLNSNISPPQNYKKLPKMGAEWTITNFFDSNKLGLIEKLQLFWYKVAVLHHICISLSVMFLSVLSHRSKRNYVALMFHCSRAGATSLWSSTFISTVDSITTTLYDRKVLLFYSKSSCSPIDLRTWLNPETPDPRSLICAPYH